MSSVSVVPSSVRNANGNNVAVDRLPDEMNDMKIRDDKVGDRHHWIYLLFMQVM